MFEDAGATTFESWKNAVSKHQSDLLEHQASFAWDIHFLMSYAAGICVKDIHKQITDALPDPERAFFPMARDALSNVKRMQLGIRLVACRPSLGEEVGDVVDFLEHSVGSWLTLLGEKCSTIVVQLHEGNR